MVKILVICGPTAIGKTSLALDLAKKFSGEIISADSRQVYKRMNIGTGKDLPRNSKLQIVKGKEGREGYGYFETKGIKIWGYDLVDPQKDFSVSKYVKIASEILADIISRRKLPIIVGGTGFYIKALIDGVPTLHIPKNPKLRKSIEILGVEELYEHLAQMDSLKAASLNISDRKNPRRLVRATEVAQWKMNNKFNPEPENIFSKASLLFIGLTTKKQLLFKRVEKRVDSRIDLGFEKEVKDLILNEKLGDKQSMLSLGYKQWKEVYLGEKTKEEAIREWKDKEKLYIKRQLTWFMKDKRIVWFDIARKGWKESLEKYVGNWYSRT